MNQASRKSSLTSQIVWLLVICIIIMQLRNFYVNGEILELFNSMVSAFVWAYLQRSVGSKTEWEATKSNIENVVVKENKDTPIEELWEMEELAPLVPNHLD